MREAPPWEQPCICGGGSFRPTVSALCLYPFAAAKRRQSLEWRVTERSVPGDCYSRDYKDVNESRSVQSGRFPLLAKEGWPRHKEMVPFRKGADGVVAHKLCFGMRFETGLVVDSFC